MRLRILSFRFLFLAALAFSQAAQGMLPGTMLCREETGSVVLEWAEDGQCQAPAPVSPRLHAESPSRESSEHCGPCFDIPLPSETSLRSAVVSSDLDPAALVASALVFVEPSAALPALAPASGSLSTGRLASVRLLI